MFAVVTCLTMLLSTILPSEPIENRVKGESGIPMNTLPEPTLKYIQPGELDARSAAYLDMLRNHLDARAVANFELALIEIMNSVKPELFGLGKKLAVRPIKNPDNDIFIIGARGQTEGRNYDSFDAAAMVEKILRKRKIASAVYSGIDELGLFENHFFTVTDFGVVIDATPLYPLLSAKHFPLRAVSREEITAHIEEGAIKIEGHIPFSFSEENGRRYISSIGADMAEAPVEELLRRQFLGREDRAIGFTYVLNEIEASRIIRSYMIEISVRPEALQSFIHGLLIKSMDGFDFYRNLGLFELASAGAIELREQGIGRVYGDAKTEEIPLPAERIDDLKKIARRDMRTAADFIRNVAFSMLSIQFIS